MNKLFKDCTEEEKETRRLYYRKWYQKHKYRLRKKTNEQYYKHRTTIRNNAKEKYKKEKENRDNSAFFNTRDMKRFLNKINSLQKVSGEKVPRCIICGTEDPRVLTINHINGNGSVDSNNYGNMAVAVSRGRKVDDLDVRCFNCNIIYEFERGKRGPKNWSELYNNVINDIHVTLTKIKIE